MNKTLTGRTSLFPVAVLFGMVCCLPLALAEAPYVDPDQDLEYLGAAENILFWRDEEKVAGFRNTDKIAPTREIKAGNSPLALPAMPVELGAVTVQRNQVSVTLDELLVTQSVAGLLVVKDGTIIYEKYRLGNDENTRWISFSVAKSVVSMLIGAAIQDGYIYSVNDKVTDYLPRLRDSSYDDSSIGNLLQMASGVEWNEDYADPESDVATASWATTDLYEFLRDKPRTARPGTTFNYNTAETNLAGTLLRSAIGNNLSTYLSEKIWKPFGMESDASWQLTEPGGGEFGGCCINATLRDYGRIGLFALGNGKLADGTEVLPRDWMDASTVSSDGYDGYGYFWWLYGPDVYQAIGIFGQGIYINRAENVVIALHSARDDADNGQDWEWQDAMYAAIVDAVRSR